MPKKKMIDIDLLEDEINAEKHSRDSDMVFISANTEAPKAPKSDMNRVERLNASRINVQEPLFNGETNLDLGKVTIGNEEDTNQINKDLLKKQNRDNAITETSKQNINTMISEMHGKAPEEIVTADEEGNVIENSTLEPAELLSPDVIERHEHKRANSKAVQQILEDLNTLGM